MFNANLALPKLNKLYVRILSSGVLASIGLAVGLIPEVSMRSPDLNKPLLTVSLSHGMPTPRQLTPVEKTENLYYKEGSFSV